MDEGELHVVTGAFGYSGSYIARRLLEAGHRVRTLTNSPDRPHPLREQVEARPLNFDDPAALAESLHGAAVLYNTYWVRFNSRRSGRARFTHSEAVDNTRKLFEAAKTAGVRRVVHVSITNPSEDSPLEYFSGKAVLERALAESGLSYAILRPTVLFGKEDVLVNNIAWCLRRFPLFGLFGNGAYRLQPIYVDDLAQLAVEQGLASENATIDAIGPETFTFRELVETIGKIISKPRRVIGLPPWMAHLAGAMLGRIVGDVMITRAEVKGLMANLLYVDSPPAGTTKLTDWAEAHADHLGVRYTSEMARRTNRETAYEEL